MQELILKRFKDYNLWKKKTAYLQMAASGFVQISIYIQKEGIYKDGLRHDISIDAIFKHPVYFGQKDLSNKDIDFEADLVNKLIGNRLESIRTIIDSKKSEIKNIITNINNY